MMNNKVTYSDIKEALSNDSGISKQKSNDFIKGLIKYIQQELQNSGHATITNFGSFKVKNVAAREGKNPRTGESIKISAYKKVTFSPYKNLKETVNAPYQNLETQLVEENKSVQRNIFKPSQLAEKKRISGPATIILSGLVLLVVAVTAMWYLMDSGTSEVQSAAEQVAVEETKDAPSDNQKLKTTTNSKAEIPKDNDKQENGVKGANSVALTVSTDEKTNASPKKNKAVYNVQNDEWLWVISKKVYGKSEWWPLIYLENQFLNEDPDILLTNMNLQVPNLKGSAEKPKKEDYKILAEAAFQVSEAYMKFNKQEKAEEYARFATRYERLGK